MMDHATLAGWYGRAATDLETHGRAQGRLVNKQGQACLVGAMNRNAPNTRLDWHIDAGIDSIFSQYRSVYDEIGAEIDKSSWWVRAITKLVDRTDGRVEAWNDLTFSTSKVVNLLRRLEARHAHLAIDELQIRIASLEAELASARERIFALTEEVSFWKRAFMGKNRRAERAVDAIEAELAELSRTYEKLQTHI